MHKTGWMQLAVFVTAALVASFDIGKTDRVIALQASAPGSWRLIAQTTADFSADHNVIVFGGLYDKVRSIKFEVTNAPLHLVQLVVRYDSGGVERIAVRQDIPSGGESQVIELAGAGAESLRRVECWYDAGAVEQGRADLTLLGME
jgi:hypothetical protein